MAFARLSRQALLMITLIITLFLLAGTGGLSYRIRADATEVALEMARAEQTAVAAAAQATVSAEQTMFALTPTPVPTPVPAYLANTTGGFTAWNGPGDWEYQNGALVNNGFNRIQGAWIAAPFQPRTASYAVEADIQVTSTTCSDDNDDRRNFGIIVRADSDDDGYWAGVDCANTAGISNGSSFCCDKIAQQGLHTDTSRHTYRVEVDGTIIRLLIDGRLVLETRHSAHGTAGEIGLWSYGVRVQVHSFKVDEL